MALDYDLEEALALQKMKEVQALRRSNPAEAGGERFGRFYAPNFGTMATSFVDKLSGNRMEDQAIARQRELADLQQGEVQDYIQQMKTPGVALRQGEGPLLDPTRPMNPEEENQRQMGLSMDAMRLPKAKAMATQFVNSGVGFPEKMAQLNMNQALLREQQAARLAAQKEAADAKIAAIARENQLTRENRIFLKTLGNSVGGANSNLDRQIKELRLKQMQDGSAPKPTTESERVSAGYLGRMEAAEKKLTDAEPLDIVRQKGLELAPSVTNFVMSPKEQVVRQKQEDWVRAKLRKESGATIRDDEMAREIRNYFPQSGDKPEVLHQKAQSRAQALEQLRSTAGRALPTEATAVGAPSSSTYDTDKEARYQAWKKAQGM